MLGYNRALIAPARDIGKPASIALTKMLNERVKLGFSKLANSMNAQRLKLNTCLRTDATDLTRGKRPHAGGEIRVSEHGKAAGLLQLGSDLGEELVGADANGAGEARCAVNCPRSLI